MWSLQHLSRSTKQLQLSSAASVPMDTFLHIHCDWWLCFHLLCCQINKLFFPSSTAPSPLMIMFVRYGSTAGPVPGQIGLRLPMFPQVFYYSPSRRHNVITCWCPLFAALLFRCCVHEFINSTLWLVIHSSCSRGPSLYHMSHSGTFQAKCITAVRSGEERKIVFFLFFFFT